MIAAANLAHRRVTQGRLPPEADRIGGTTCQPPSARSAAIDARDDAVETVILSQGKGNRSLRDHPGPGKQIFPGFAGALLICRDAARAGDRLFRQLPTGLSGQPRSAARRDRAIPGIGQAAGRHWSAPIVEAPKGRRDEFVEPY